MALIPTMFNTTCGTKKALCMYGNTGVTPAGIISHHTVASSKQILKCIPYMHAYHVANQIKIHNEVIYGYYFIYGITIMVVTLMATYMTLFYHKILNKSHKITCVQLLMYQISFSEIL